jgi:hypothetical protein
MIWWHLVLAFLAGAIGANGVPHYVAGVMGRKFPTPFSGGAGTLDGAVRNVGWGAFNFALAGVFLWLTAASFGSVAYWAIFVIGALAMSLGLAFVFSRETH